MFTLVMVTDYQYCKIQSCPRIHLFSIRDFSYPRFIAARKKQLTTNIQTTLKTEHGNTELLERVGVG
jgi:hypothetical protein